jgi:acyl-CoA synthetase (NDP forming)
MDRETATGIERILDRAGAEKRTTFFEHEVYEILGLMGLAVPAHIMVREVKDITKASLSLFPGDKIVLKVVSPEVAHKKKAGGVRVVHRDLDFVRYSAAEMRGSIEARGISVEGVLLVEFVPYSQEVGNEILIGFRESEAFGPVLSFSKGGADAEHFALHYSAPNVVLPPISREWALALLSSTKIQQKYLAEGKTDFISRIADAETRFSDLAVGFSNFFESPSMYAIKEFEINPFVFDDRGRFIALDGYATFAPKEAPADLSVPPKESLRSFFEPEGIAVVGVSGSDPGKPGNIIAENLFKLGRGDVYCVNPRGGTAHIGGKTIPLLKSLGAAARRIDLVIVSVPAESASAVIEDAAASGAKAVLVIPGGFSETTKDHTIEDRILKTARSNGMRVVGPNCLGIIYAGDGRPGINTFFIPEEKFKVNFGKKRNVAILSQSGAMGIMELYNLRNAISPKVVVSYGNQLDVDPSDLVQYFEEDPNVDVIGLYIEGFKKAAGRKFFNVTAKSRKPIVVYKAGRTEAGMMAAQSHTASIAGEYEVAKAAMKQAGLIVAPSMIDHGDLIKTFALLHDFPVSGNRVAVIANAGYEKTSAADNLGDLVLASLDRETLQALREVIPPYVSAEPLLDLTPMVSDEQFEKCIDIMLSSNAVDCLCVSIVPQAQVLHTTDDEMASYEKNIAARIVETVHRRKKPVVVSVNVVSGADAAYNKFGQVMDSGGVPTFLTAERAMVCLNAFVRYKLITEKRVISEWLR